MTAPSRLIPTWPTGAAQVPREAFLPARVLDPDAPQTWVDRSDKPRRWAALAEADLPLVTALDPAPGREDFPTSSASKPSVIAGMIGLLEPWPGPRGLVVGTGTGWHTSLLAALHPGAEVVSVDIDPRWTAHAADAARRAGVRPLPEFATGDGLAGWPGQAPFDWVCATCAVDRIPAAWLDQTRPGGVILTPWYSRWTAYGLAHLTVTGPGRAEGRFVADASFMRARRDAVSYTEHVARRDVHAAGPRTSTTHLHPELVSDLPEHLDAAFALGLMLPGHRWHRLDNPDLATDPTWCCSHLYVAPDGKSWAEVEHADGDGKPVMTVDQYGPEDVWARVEAAYGAWNRLGRPGVDAWRITARRDGASVWADTDPGQVWDLPTEQTSD